MFTSSQIVLVQESISLGIMLSLSTEMYSIKQLYMPFLFDGEPISVGYLLDSRI